MWKCKKCGCLNFRIGIGGYVDVDFNDKLKVTKGIVNREIIRHEIRKNKRKIKILEWVLEG